MTTEDYKLLKETAETARFVEDIRGALDSTQGSDDIASMLDVLMTDMKQVIRILIREGLAEPSEFKLEIEDDE